MNNFKHYALCCPDYFESMDMLENITTTELPKIDVRTVKSTRSCRSCDKFGYRYLRQKFTKQIKTQDESGGCRIRYVTQ